ncbi:unnamed protein product [Adineta steineri]|uniref:Uncharacterized protein n=2 Tax=Adineta steineri TaxID=433720 RepID=A0A818TGM8_9BILA|nr:unnamed protein product [Adineta steineri]
MDTNYLIELRRKFEALRRPIGFNYAHFLLIYLYNSSSSSSSIIKTYPLYSIFDRLQRKLNLNEQDNHQIIINAINVILSQNDVYLTETVEQTHLNIRTYPILCLFRLYSPIHLILFMEPLIVLNDEGLSAKIKKIFTNEYPKDKCDYVHFCIAHRKTNLIMNFLSGSIQQEENNDNWLIKKINAPSDRSWLPIHYASYIGDRDLIEKLCTKYSELMNPLYFVLPKSRMRDFSDSPFDYLLRASGMKTHLTNIGNTIVNLDDNDIDDDSPILPLMSDDEDDEEFLLSSPLLIEQNKDERTDSFLEDQHAMEVADADIPDADLLEASMQFSRDILLRSLIEQGKGTVYFIPSPLLLASACPLNGKQYKQAYDDVVQHLLNSNLVNIDGLNHDSLTKNTIEYFSRHKYADFTSTKSIPYIYYQCNALFTSSSIGNQSRMSEMSEDGHSMFKIVYFITILTQRSLFSRYENFDQYLLRDLLQLHSHQLEKAFGEKITYNQYTKGRILEQEQINELTFRLLIRYNIHQEENSFEIDINYFFNDSYSDQFADTYISLFHTPITMAIQNGCLSIAEILLSNISLNTNTHWGTLAMYELETCVDQLFTRRGKITFDMFTTFCTSIANIHSDEAIIQQRIFVHALATCIKYKAKTELEHLINNYANIYYDSCEKYPSDIRHNILSYCVVRNQAVILEELMSAFSSLNSNSSQLYISSLFNQSSVSTNSLATIFNTNPNNKTKTFGISTTNIAIHSYTGDEYRQCRRIRNTAIAHQQKHNPNQYLSSHDNSTSTPHPTRDRPQPRPSRFWRTVRSLQIGFRQRGRTGQYVQQINNSDPMDHRTTTGTSLQIINEDESAFRRADLEVAQPVFNELPATMPIMPQPVFISLTSNDQEDEKDIIPITGQTLLHIAAKLPDHDDIVRVLIGENNNMTSLVNSNGQIPLLCAIQAGNTLTAQLLVEADPHSLITLDNRKSSVFHYCCETKNDLLLASMLNLLRRLSANQSVRVQALQNLTEPNADGQTPFSIACYKGSIKCLKQLFGSKWLLRRVHASNIITSDGIKKCIDNNQIDIINYLVSDLRRFRVIISILIDVVFTEPVHPSTDMVVARRQYNVLEYAILLKKTEFVRTFVSVSVPKTIEKKANVDEHIAVVRSSNVVTLEPLLHDEYKRFLTRYSLPFKYDQFDQTPIQRMLKVPALIPFVPNLLEQFLDGDGMDLSVIDDCLCSKPKSSRCIFGQNSSIHNTSQTVNKKDNFTPAQWIKEHPLNLISECDYAPIYDHPLILTTVDSKADLFGNLLYLFILLIQALYVILYTGVTLVTRTPKFYQHTYVEFENDTCIDMCDILTNGTHNFDYSDDGTFILYIFRFILFLFSCAALLKEFYQILTQRGRYFRGFFLNLLEIITYSCGIIFAMDTNDCSKYSSLRCKYQYDFGALGVASVWTVLLLVFVNSLKLGKYGLLFITIFLTFIKFCFIYVFIWIGYLFAFHMLLTQNPSFETVFTSIPRMIAMLTGEFNFENLFYTEGEPVRGTTMAKVIFSTFVFVVHICVMNILIGLAVSDVNDFQKNAKRENLRSRILTVLNFQAKFGPLCSASSKLMFTLGRNFPQFLTGLKFDVTQLSLRIKPIQVPNRAMRLIQCRVGYVPIKKTKEITSNVVQDRENVQEVYNENLIHKVNEIREEIDKTQLKFTQELHRLTINLSKLIDK